MNLEINLVKICNYKVIILSDISSYFLSVYHLVHAGFFLSGVLKRVICQNL